MEQAVLTGICINVELDPFFDTFMGIFLDVEIGKKRLDVNLAFFPNRVPNAYTDEKVKQNLIDFYVERECKALISGCKRNNIAEPDITTFREVIRLKMPLIIKICMEQRNMEWDADTGEILIR